MRSLYRCTTYLLLFTFAWQTVLTTPLYADHIFARIARLGKESHYCGTEPATCEDGAIEQLAENIDWLEHHIDCYGSVVAKQPDIWGEARLTKHRDEYERILYSELNQFEFTLNAAISQSDQSYASAALALSNAAGADGTPPALNSTPLQVNVEGVPTSLPDGSDLQQPTSQGAPITGVNLTKFNEAKINIEPTTYLDQMSRYVNHLHELRRINEGDDTSDSPGYALNLVRMPVSLTPGKITREGWGAEITITADPVLSDDLLPTTFRNLVVNDLVDQLGLPLVRTAETTPIRQHRTLIDQKDKQLASQLLAKTKQKFLANKFEKKGEIEAEIKSLLQNDRIRTALIEQFQRIQGFIACARGCESCPLTNPEACYEKFGVKGEIQKDLFLNVAQIANLAISAKSPKVTSVKVAGIYEGLKTFAGSSPEGNQTITDLATLLVDINELAYDANRKKFLVGAVNNGPDKLKLETAGPEINQQPAEPNAESTEDGIYNSFISDTATYDRSKLEQKYLKYPRPAAEIQNWSRMAASQTRKSTQALIKVVSSVIGAANETISSSDSSLSRTAIPVAQISAGRTRRAHHPIPPSQVAEIYGTDQIVALADFFYQTYYGRHVRWSGSKHPAAEKIAANFEHRVNLLDAQKWLQAELAAAHELLSQPEHLHIWHAFSRPQSKLAETIRSEHLSKEIWGEMSLESFRNCFFYNIQKHPSNESTFGAHTIVMPATGPMPFEVECTKHQASTPAEALAWTIVVESALLNQRLNEDIRKVAVSRDCPCVGLGEDDLTFFLPEVAAKQSSGLSHEFATATKVFQEYVKCRWPIHVFALDPRESDQNVADVSARRRELQLALSMGFVTGEISANTLMNYSRQLETQVETISLNRTISSFSHGNDTFGWRFYPRVQALDQPGAIGSVWQSFRGTPRDRDVCHRQIEPGMRECVAIVLMPSFVPYADFNVRSNWFRLHNPKNAALTMKDTVKLSRAVTTMRRSKAQCSQCAHLYRDGEVNRLMKRVHQLDRELPLQSMRTQVPYENTLGGFEMFNTGVTDLAPELIGWYGAPGVVIAGDDKPYTCGCNSGCPADEATTAAIKAALDAHEAANHVSTAKPAKQSPFPICEGQGTTLFLVGDNFSVHDTKVIAGGVCIPNVRLISREIMRVTIPSCVNTVEVDGKPYVAVYASTPYGVTNHLHVPIHSRTVAKETKTAIETAVTAEVNKQVGALKLAPRDIGISFKAGSKMEIIAECDKNHPTELLFAKKPGSSIPTATYEVLNSHLEGELATFFAAVYYKGKFRGGMVPILVEETVDGTSVLTSEFKLRSSGTITSKDLETIKDQIIAQVESAIGISELTDGKEAAKLVFFANLQCLQCKAASMRLIDEMDIEITNPCKCCEATTTAPATKTAPAVPTVSAAPTNTLPAPPAVGSSNSAAEAEVLQDVPPATDGTSNQSGSGAKTSATSAPCNCSAIRVIEGAVR